MPNVVRCAFDYGYKDHPERLNPAAGLVRLRMTKKDRPVVDPFTIQEAESLIARLHADWGEAIGNTTASGWSMGVIRNDTIGCRISSRLPLRG